MAFNFASGRNFIEMLAHTVRDEKRAPLKTLAWEANTVDAVGTFFVQYLSN